MEEASQGVSKNQVKLIKSLAIKKYRYKQNLFIVEGKKLIQELFKSSFRIRNCWILNEDASPELPSFVEYIDSETLKRLSQLQSPHYGLAIVEIPEKTEIRSQKVQLVLDGIGDPGNMGTIIRLADWYGIEQIVCVNNCVDPYNYKTVQASMGSIFRVEVNKQDISQLHLQSPVYGAFLDGDNIHKSMLKSPCSLVIGSESLGISEEIARRCEEKISIPRFGAAESLNAAIATGIILDHFAQLD